MSRRDRGDGGGIGWLVAGLAAGLTTGVFLAAYVGPVSRRRVGDLVRRLRTPPAPRLSGSARVEAAKAALSADPQLAGLALQPITGSFGVVELHGWVPDRSARSRAARLVAAVAGVANVVNRLLVRGEDDRAIPAEEDSADQTA